MPWLMIGHVERLLPGLWDFFGSLLSMGCAFGEKAREYDSLAGTSRYSPLQEGVESRLWWSQMPWGLVGSEGRLLPGLWGSGGWG